MHRRVDFVVGGVQKAGTSALAKMLDEHPGITMAEVKEPHFFDNEAEFRRFWGPRFSKYHRLFDSRAKGLLGEATPILTY